MRRTAQVVGRLRYRHLFVLRARAGRHALEKWVNKMCGRWYWLAASTCNKVCFTPVALQSISCPIPPAQIGGAARAARPPPLRNGRWSPW